MSAKGLEVVFHRNQFYFGAYRQMAVSAVLLFLFSILLLGFVFYQRSTYPAPRYFATTADGIPIPIIPLDQALQSPEFVLNWASDAVVKIYALDFVSFRRSLQSSQAYFTWKGHVDFMLALKASTNLDAVQAKKQVVSVAVTGNPSLVDQGLAKGIYYWQITLPLTFTYQNSANEVITQKGVAAMRIERASTLQHSEGIAIAQLIFQPVY